MSKTCIQCNEIKSIENFYFRGNESRIINVCNICVKINDKIYREKNKENIIKYRKEHKNEAKQYREDNKEKLIEYNIMYRNNNPEYHKKYILDNPDYYKVYRNDNKVILNKKRNIREKKCRKNPINIIKNCLRNRLNKALNNNYKSGSHISDLGCSAEKLKQYLESKFYLNPETGEEMNWNNHSLHGWHIDYIKPLSSFDLTNKEELLKAVHYTNLQPMWAKENLKKGKKII